MFLPAVIRFNASAESMQKEKRLQRMAHAMGLKSGSDIPEAQERRNAAQTDRSSAVIRKRTAEKQVAVIRGRGRAEIAAASQEQSAGIEQVNMSIIEMDSMTQQNAALVEEAAAAAQSLLGTPTVASGSASVSEDHNSSLAGRALKAAGCCVVTGIRCRPQPASRQEPTTASDTEREQGIIVQTLQYRPCF